MVDSVERTSERRSWLARLDGREVDLKDAEDQERWTVDRISVSYTRSVRNRSGLELAREEWRGKKDRKLTFTDSSTPILS